MKGKEVQTGFKNGHTLDQQIGRASNVTNEEEIIFMAYIPAYMMNIGFEQYLDADMVYERPMDSSDSSSIISHALAFLRYCMIRKWRQNESKPFLS